MRRVNRCDIVAVMEAVSGNPFIRQATRFVAQDFVVKATRRFRARVDRLHVETLLCFGRPNYAERAFIKACKKAGESFPVRKVQVKYWPAKKGSGVK